MKLQLKMDSWVILWFSIMLTLLWGQGTKVNPPGMWARVLTKYYLYRITTKVWNGSLHFFIEASLPDTHLLVWSKPTESFEIDNTPPQSYRGWNGRSQRATSFSQHSSIYCLLARVDQLHFECAGYICRSARGIQVHPATRQDSVVACFQHADLSFV